MHTEENKNKTKLRCIIIFKYNLYCNKKKKNLLSLLAPNFFKNNRHGIRIVIIINTNAYNLRVLPDLQSKVITPGL